MSFTNSRTHEQLDLQSSSIKSSSRETNTFGFRRIKKRAKRFGNFFPNIEKNRTTPFPSKGSRRKKTRGVGRLGFLF
ncbi:hypothetical protein GQ457_03G018490 [Hibiscus cannabinus]